jgi:hypothetical protein
LYKHKIHRTSRLIGAFAASLVQNSGNSYFIVLKGTMFSIYLHRLTDSFSAQDYKGDDMQNFIITC